jgi:hypothetical protein
MVVDPDGVGGGIEAVPHGRSRPGLHGASLESIDGGRH